MRSETHFHHLSSSWNASRKHDLAEHVRAAATFAFHAAIIAAYVVVAAGLCAVALLFIFNVATGL
jgi:hypothetical protein